MPDYDTDRVYYESFLQWVSVLDKPTYWRIMTRTITKQEMLISVRDWAQTITNNG